MPAEVIAAKASEAIDNCDNEKETMDTSPSANEIDSATVNDVKENIRLVERGLTTKEEHYFTRAIRAVTYIRKRLNNNVLKNLVQIYFPRSSSQKKFFLDYLPEIIDESALPKSKTTKLGAVSTEVEVYLHLLLLVYLIDQKLYEEATKCSDVLMERLNSSNKRSLAILASKCYFYHSRAYELVDRLQFIRPFLHARLRTATLRNHCETQAVLINLLLHNYLHYHLYDQAYKLISKVVFPELAPNNKWARYLYYLGRIKAIQLDYSTAHDHLVSALRKAPQHSAIGFKQTLHKLNTVVELLLGDIPDRATFRDPQFKDALQPYFELTQAIHTGDLKQFNSVLHSNGSQFSVDETYSLIVRLRHNVIKTGVRRISLSYSRISLADVATKLQLDSAKDAEYIVAKAIRDGVIDAIIDHEKGCMTTKENVDLYSTREPMDQLHQRVKFCLGIRNQAVKAMRYPPKQYNKDLETAEERKEREQQELEAAKELSEDDYDGFP